MKRGRFFSIYILMFFCLYATGQTLDDAKSWYLEGRYAQALPVFQTEYLIIHLSTNGLGSAFTKPGE